jgi:3'-phosphoadenosine 5'-phosphosulfate sulfotransferase (PAPS reductase)/FAD synthetase
MMHIVALSGGKDSTAMALRLKEINPDMEYTYICTPTGDELPEMVCHWKNIEMILGQPIQYLHHKLDLKGLCEYFKMLPNFRSRWCTRMLKIQVAQAFYLEHPGSVSYVGLRADEEKRVGGIYGDIIEQHYPLREWGWGIKEVLQYLNQKNIIMPRRTDCARCFDQRIGEWWDLWKINPDIYADAEKQEEQFGHTFRSEQRDSWPASLKDLRAEFEKGKIPRGAEVQTDLFEEKRCRVCSI